MKNYLKISLAILSFCLIIAPFTVGAQVGDPQYEQDLGQDYLDPAANNTPGAAPLMDRLTNVAGQAGYNTDPTKASTPRIVGMIVGAFINFTGLTFIVLMIIAGYGWMTSNGNEEKVKKAGATIKASIIGLIVSLSAWVLWNFIFQKLILG